MLTKEMALIKSPSYKLQNNLRKTARILLRYKDVSSKENGHEEVTTIDAKTLTHISRKELRTWKYID